MNRRNLGEESFPLTPTLDRRAGAGMLRAVLAQAALLALLALGPQATATPEPTERKSKLFLPLETAAGAAALSRAPSAPVPPPVTVPFDRRLQVGHIPIGKATWRMTHTHASAGLPSRAQCPRSRLYPKFWRLRCQTLKIIG